MSRMHRQSLLCSVCSLLCHLCCVTIIVLGVGVSLWAIQLCVRHAALCLTRTHDMLDIHFFSIV